MDKWQVSVAPGSDFLLLLADDHDTSWDQVADAAERALDVLSVMAGQSYEVASVDTQTERLKWRWDGSRFHVEVLLLWRLHAPVTLLTGHVADGPPRNEQPRPRYHAGMRYFRCSQVAGNAALAFQYLFLSLESLLAERHPKRRDQRELDWLKEAIATAATSYLTVARDAVAARGGTDADIDHIYAVRLGLFHSKPDREPLVPFDLGSEARIRDAYWKLATHVLELLRGRNVWPAGQTLGTEREVNQQGTFLQELVRTGLAFELHQGAPKSAARVISATRSEEKFPSFLVDWDFPEGIPANLRGFTWNFGGIQPSHKLSLVPITAAPTTLRVSLRVDGGLQHVMRC